MDNIEKNPNKQFGNLVSTFLDDLNERYFVEMAKTKIRMAMNEVSQMKCQQQLKNQMYGAQSTQQLYEDYAFPMDPPNRAERVDLDTEDNSQM